MHSFSSDHRKCRDCGAYFKKSRADAVVRCPACRGHKAKVEVAKARVEFEGPKGFAVYAVDGAEVARDFKRSEAIAAAEAAGHAVA